VVLAFFEHHHVSGVNKVKRSAGEPFSHVSHCSPIVPSRKVYEDITN
jgi:hypothetical protein